MREKSKDLNEGGYIKVKSKKTGIVWKWRGGHGISGYIGEKEVAFLTFGDFSKDVTPEEATKKLKELANASPKEQASYATDEDLAWKILVYSKIMKHKKVRV
jgi:hypothetical protein